MIKLKHKAAWWLRKWANKLEPQAPYIPPPLMYGGKEYQLQPLRLRANLAHAWGNPELMQYEYDRAVRQIGVAASTKVEYGQIESDTVEFQLLILTPKDGK